jgi:hypothetical protein
MANFALLLGIKKKEIRKTNKVEYIRTAFLNDQNVMKKSKENK